MSRENAFKLNEHEQNCLIHAIESAIEVRHQDHFHAWMRGPFRALMPHECAVCMEIDDEGNVSHIECLQQSLGVAAEMDSLCNPEHGLALRLAMSLRSSSKKTITMDASEIHALIELRSTGTITDAIAPSSAVIHKTTFLSGAACYFVLFNVPPDTLQRCHHLFNLLSSHVKMALARAIAPEGRERTARLTEREIDILRLMREAKSNREISGILGINAMTLKSHISKLYRKLNVQNRTEAVARGLAPVADAGGGNSPSIG